VPVIGLVQVGMQASADRYMNVPIVGLLIALVFGVLDPLALRSRLSARVLVSAGTALCVTLAGMTFVQASYWKDSLTLYERAVAVTPANPLMLMMVGQAYNEAQRSDEALRAFGQAVQLSPNMGRAHAFLGRQLALAGKRDEALSHLRLAATLSPKDVQVQITVGLSMNLVGAFSEAVERFEAAARIGPADETLWIHLATARAHAGRTDAAIDAATSAVRLNPRSAPSLATLASLRLFKGHYAEADALFIRAYETDPSLWQLCKPWAEAAIGARDYNKAIKLLANYIDMQASQQQHPGSAEAVAAARARLGEVRAAAANPSALPLKPVVDLPKPDVR
jgi:protein O-mannosyl-transferase